jgi:hypothetical protein
LKNKIPNFTGIVIFQNTLHCYVTSTQHVSWENLKVKKKNEKIPSVFPLRNALGQSNGHLAFGVRRPLFWEHPSPWALPIYTKSFLSMRIVYGCMNYHANNPQW